MQCFRSFSGAGGRSRIGEDITGPAYSFGAGSHSRSASATDNAGNTASASVTFTVNVTACGMGGLVQSRVTDEGVTSSLIAKLDNAARAAARGNATAMAGQIDSFINQVQAQSGKKIPADEAPTLISLAQAP